MPQEPAGRPPQGQPTPTIPPQQSGIQALLTQALQPLQDPQGPPQPPLVLGGQPRLPPMDLPPMGEDSAPAMGGLDMEMQPPAELPPLELPEQLPQNPVEASALLDAIPIYLKNQLLRSDYQGQLEEANKVKEGPKRASEIAERLLTEPDAEGLDEEIESAAPYMPKSSTERLRASRKRRKVLRSDLDSFDQDLEKELRGRFKKSVMPKGAEVEAARLREEIARIDKELEGAPPGISTHSKWNELRATRRDLAGELSELGGGGFRGIDVEDVTSGLGQMFTNTGNVEESMLATAKKMIESRVSPPGSDSERTKAGFPALDNPYGRLISTPAAKPKLPPGVTPEMYRAALSEQAQRTIRRIKGDTTAKDLVRGSAATVPWLITGAGEIAVSSKVAQSLLAGSKLATAAPKIAKAAEVAITYIAGPAIAESAIAAVQPLSPYAQNQIDQIEDKKLREATEGAYRVLQVTQAATLSMLFSMSDVARTFAGSGSLGKRLQAYVEKSSVGKAVGSTLGMAAAAPALTELTNVGIEKLAETTRTGDVTTSDVLADMAAARRPELVGPARRLLQAKSWGEAMEAAKEYALAAAPMAVGIGTVHALSFAGAKMTARKQKLEMDRAIERDVQQMVEEADLPRDVAEVVVQELRKETEQMAPTHAEDKRRATKETIAENLGKEGGDARVMAERAADELLPDLPGKNVREKLKQAVEAHERDPDNPERQRDLEVAMRLEEGAAAKDPEEAALAVASARRRKEQAPDVDAGDLGDAALREIIDLDEARTLRPHETDAVERRVADSVTREWEPVHQDLESGDITLRALDDGERITVPEHQLGHYRMAAEEAPTPGQEAPSRSPEAPTSPQSARVRDDLYDTAVAAAQQGMVSGRQLAKSLGIGNRRAAKLLAAMEEAGVLQKEGKSYRLSETQPRRDATGEMTHSEATQVDLERLGREAEAHIDAIAAEFEAGGTTLEATERAGDLGRLLVDWGDIARPDDPEAGSAAIAAQLLRRLPEALRTDETITQTMGFPKEAIEMVRAAMDDPVVREVAQAGVGDAIRPLGSQDGLSRKAAEGPALDALPEPVRDAYEGHRLESPAEAAADVEHEAAQAALDADPEPYRPTSLKKFAGAEPSPENAAKFKQLQKEHREWRKRTEPLRQAASDAFHRYLDIRRANRDDLGKVKFDEKAAAEAAYQKWSEHDLNLTVKTHADFVKGERGEVDGILKRLTKGGKKREEALEHLADRIRDLELQDEATSLLSLTEDGRAVVKRLNELRDAIFVGGAIPDHLLASLDGGPPPSPPRNRAGESGAAYVPNFLGGGWQLLLSAGRRAQMFMRIARRTMASLFHAFKAGVVKAGVAVPIAAYRGAKALRSLVGVRTASGKRVYGTEARKAIDLGNLYARARTVAPDERGELLGGRDRGATPIAGLIDQLSHWRETDAGLMVARAAEGKKYAAEMAVQMNRVFPQDQGTDAQLTRWLQADSPEARAAIEKDWSAEQRDVASALKDFYRSMQQMASKRLLPDQLIRENEYLPHLRTVRQRLETAREALRAPLEEAVSARAKLPRPKKGEKGTPEWKAAENRVRQLRRAIKKFDEDIAGVGGDISKIHGEIEQIGKDWGIENYTPHVRNTDPHEHVSWKEGVIVMPDPRELMAKLHAVESDLMEMARDWVPQTVPARLRAKHWKSRKHAGETTMMDVSAVRSFFHYATELYRLAPAAIWYENNRDRLFGKMRPLENREIDMGSVNRADGEEGRYRSRRVRWVDFGRGKSVRADQYFQLGGKVYTLTMQGPDGATKDLHFRTAGDLQRASQMDPSSFGLGEGWAVSEDQKYGHRILLLPDKSATASPDQRIRAVELEVDEVKPEHGADVEVDADLDADLGFDEVTRQLHLPTHAQVHWPSEVYGRLSTVEPGKIHRIWRDSGKESAQAFAKYISEDVLGSATGKHILTMAQSLAAIPGDIIRHKTLGLANPAMAFKEVLDTTWNNSTYLGADNAWEAASWSVEFAKRLHKGVAAIDKKGAGEFLRQHALRDTGDGNVGVLPPMLVEAVRTPKEKLAKMSAKKRKAAELQDEAFEQFLNSSLSGGSVMAMFTPTEHRYSYGVDFRGSPLKRIGKAISKGSWWLRGRAQEHTLQQTWLGAYMVARRGGLSADEAFKQANYYSLASSVVGNRATMATSLSTAPGILIRPLASWMIGQSSVNWRYLFHSEPVDRAWQNANAGIHIAEQRAWGRIARVVARGGGRAATRLASMYATYYVLQQIGTLVGLDVTRNIGQGFTEVPVVGKWGTWQMHQLQAKLHLAATPEDAYKQLPEWRQKLVDQAREHAPTWMREWLVRQASYLGSLPADTPIFPMFGNWLPYSAETAKSWFNLAEAEFEGDTKKARGLWYRNTIGNLWFMRTRDQLYGTEPDPADENYVLVRNPATGVTNDRRKKGDYMRVLYNLIGSSTEDSIQRIERTVLQPMRDARQAASTRSSSFLAGELHQQATRANIQARNARDPDVQAKLEQVASDKRREFLDAVKEYAKANEMTPNETKGLVKRWSRAAEQNYLLTSSERDIVNAYSSDQAFRLMSNELNKVPWESQPALSKKRWEMLQGLWFADSDAMRQSLKGATKDTREKFLRALRTARERWALQEAAEQEGIHR